MTVRLMPPANGPFTISAYGRSYSCAAGATIDVPDHDAFVLQANGWVASAAGAGVSTARPTNPTKGQTFHDTTLAINIVWDGKTWRNPNTGAAV